MNEKLKSGVWSSNPIVVFIMYLSLELFILESDGTTRRFAHTTRSSFVVSGLFGFVVRSLTMTYRLFFVFHNIAYTLGSLETTDFEIELVADHYQEICCSRIKRANYGGLFVDSHTIHSVHILFEMDLAATPCFRPLSVCTYQNHKY